MNIRVIIIDLKLFLCSDHVVVDDAAAAIGIAFILHFLFVETISKKKKSFTFLSRRIPENSNTSNSTYYLQHYISVYFSVDHFPCSNARLMIMNFAKKHLNFFF